MSPVHGYRPDPPPVDEFPDVAQFDAVVIGAGPNGLMTALYLQHAGLKTVVLERRFEIGGGLATEEVLFPGYYVNTHAQYHYMVDYMPVLKDFDLGALGLAFLKPATQTTLLTRDGTALSLCRMLEDSRASAAQISVREGDRLGESLLLCRRMVEEIIGPATYVPAMPPTDQLELFNRTPLGRQVGALSDKSPLEVVGTMVEDDRLQALLTYSACQWGVSPFETGMGFMVPLLVDRTTQKAVCYGGSHRFASALARAFLKRGGTILDSAEVAAIATRDGHVTGVTMADGREVQAKIVASSLDPATNFGRLLDAKSAGDLRRRGEEWQPDKWSLFTTHLVLRQPPRYRRAPSWWGRSFMTLLGIDSMEETLQLFADVEEGKVGKLGGHFTCLTDFDPTFGNFAALHPQSPGARAVCTFQTPAPYDYDWDGARESHTREVLRLLDEYMEIDVLTAFSETPKDIERRLPNMRRGSIKHGDYSPLQMGYFRPDVSCAGGRTPVTGFYVCGASSYPGGMVIGGPGYIAARSILADAGRTPLPYPDSIRKYLSTYGDAETET